MLQLQILLNRIANLISLIYLPCIIEMLKMIAEKRMRLFPNLCSTYLCFSLPHSIRFSLQLHRQQKLEIRRLPLSRFLPSFPLYIHAKFSKEEKKNNITIHHSATTIYTRILSLTKPVIFLPHFLSHPSSKRKK